MKVLSLAVAFACLVYFCPDSVKADDFVGSYYRANGTQVNGYHRTRPNQSTYDNYSTQGNINPYTGQQGTVSSYSNSALNQPKRDQRPAVLYPQNSPLW